ncbi:MAG: lysoplasmalogenase [Kofleriaceae bacterium]|nr:lysoplasmalogenase [Kofleriaceae bacterium]
MITIAVTVLCGVCCALLVGCEVRSGTAQAPQQRQRLERIRQLSKLAASTCFVLVPLVGGGFSADRHDHGLATWMMIGLVLGATGDAALLAHSSTGFLIGLGAFLLGHLAYVVGFSRCVAGTAISSATLALALIPIVAGGLALRWLWRYLGDMRIPVLAYVTVITAMMIAAIAVLHDSTRNLPFRYLIGSGATLFFISDLAVARDRFVAPGWRNRAWGLPAYYTGQLLLAWSITP